MKRIYIIALLVLLISSAAFSSFYSGLSKYRNGNYWGAVSDFTEVLKSNNKHIKAMAYLSAALFSLGKYGRIMNTFPGLIKNGIINLNNKAHAKDNCLILMNIGRACYYTGNSKKAIIAFSICNKISNNDDAVFNFLGLAYLKVGAYMSAEISFQTAVNLRPRNFVYHNNLGAAYLELKRYKDALSSFEASVRINWNYYNGWDNVWVSREKLGWTAHRGWKSYSYFVSLTKKEKSSWDWKEKKKIKEMERRRKERLRRDKELRRKEEARLKKLSLKKREELRKRREAIKRREEEQRRRKAEQKKKADAERKRREAERKRLEEKKKKSLQKNKPIIYIPGTKCSN